MQVEAVRAGMGRIFPVQCLNLLTGSDLESLVCGRAEIDVELLRRHTVRTFALAAREWAGPR